MVSNGRRDWASRDGAIQKRIVDEGEWDGGCPQEGATCEVSFEGVEGERSGSRYLAGGEGRAEVVIGGGDTLIDSLIDRAVRRMWKRETSEVVLCERLRFKVKLISYQNPEILYHNLDAESEARLAGIHKDKGSVLFKQGRIEDALRRFSSAARFVVFAGVKGNEELYHKICNNIALCKLRLGSPEHAITLCNKVLEGPSSSGGVEVKALVRRAEGLLGVKEPRRARDDLRDALRLAPDDPTARRLLAKTLQDLAKQKQESTSLAKRMLDL